MYRLVRITHHAVLVAVVGTVATLVLLWGWTAVFHFLIGDAAWYYIPAAVTAGVTITGTILWTLVMSTSAETRKKMFDRELQNTMNTLKG